MVDAVDIKVKKRKAVSSAEMKDGQDDSKMETSEPAAATLEASNDEEREDEVEVEVLSHAEQRKRRKLEKAKALSRGVDGVDVDESEEAVAAGTSLSANKANAAEPPKASRSTFGIWVGNLSFKTDADKLRAFFNPCGNITRINLPKGTRFQPNKGFAYIDFDTREALTQAIALSESNLDGRRLLIKDSGDYKGRPVNENVDAAAKTLLGGEGKPTTEGEGAGSAKKSLSKTARKILERQKNPPAPTLFIGNLAYDATIDSIREAFEARAIARQRWESKKGSKKGDRKGKGKASDDESDEDSDEDAASNASVDPETEDVKPKKKIESTSIDQASPAGIRQVRIGTFEDSGKCKGWAFVDFQNAVQATQSLIDGRNHYMNGRTLNVEYASADAVRRGGGKMEGGDAASAQKKGRPEGRSSGFQSSKRKRDNNDNNAEEGSGRQESNQEQEMPKQAFYRPPLALQPWQDAAKVHKPNKEERQALREDKKTKGRRQKPGAALANAQREKIAIQPGAGKKTTFE